MRAELPRLRRCGEGFYARDATAGTVRVDARFAVARDGRVTGARVGGGDATLASCLCDRLLAMPVPGVGGAGTISYPLVLDP